MEGQSVYTTISKSIGFNRVSITRFPSIDRALELRQKSSEGDRSAFYEAFTLHRFLGPPENEQEIYIVNLIYEAYIAGDKIWRNVVDPYVMESIEGD